MRYHCANNCIHLMSAPLCQSKMNRFIERLLCIGALRLALIGDLNRHRAT